MEKKYKLGVIGAGFMASAIIGGIIKSSVLSPDEIIVSDPSEDKLVVMQKKGVNVTQDNLYLSDNSEFVLFAVKPQSLSDVLSVMGGTVCRKFISIMAGVKKQKIKDRINGAVVARCMPNTPCSVGFGAIGIDMSDFVSDSDKEFVRNVFSSVAKVEYVSEDLLNAVTGVSGSSPAYFYMFIKGIIDAGVKQGLTNEQAKTLAVSTMIGAGKMLENAPDKPIDELIAAVCSKGGTTIEAVKTFENGGLYALINEAIEACVNRAKELEDV